MAEGEVASASLLAPRRHTLTLSRRISVRSCLILIAGSDRKEQSSSTFTSRYASSIHPHGAIDARARVANSPSSLPSTLI